MTMAVRVLLAQVATALLILAWAAGPEWAVAAVPFALLAVVRVRRRWVGDVIRFFGRRRSLPADAGLLSLVRPGAVMTSVDLDGVDVGVVEDADGLAATVRIGDLTDLLGDALPPIPPLSTLLPPTARDVPQARVQLLVSAITAPSPTARASASGTSYRQLTDGRVLAHQRVLLSIRIRRAGGYQREDLERTLVSAIRRACRLLTKAGLPARPLSTASMLAALAEAAQHRPGQPIHERWRGLRIGGLHQAAFRLRRWPHAGPGATRLLTLPCSAVTVSLTAADSTTSADPTADTCRAELTIRLAAPTAAALDQATSALHRLVTSLDAAVDRLDGAHLDGLAATLPLGGGAPTDAAALAGLLTDHDDLALHGARAPHVTAIRLASLEPTVGGDGLMLGVDRDGAPVVIRPFRAEPTRAVLIGGLRCTEMLVLRTLALGAHVIVQSSRPQDWTPFLRGLGGEQLTMVPADRPIDPPPATAAHPQLLVIDVGPLDDQPSPADESAWRATLLVRDDLTAADANLLTRADLVLLQPLTPPEAAIATTALGLVESAAWLTRIAPEMLGIVVSRRKVRWTHLSPTPVELQLTGGPSR